MSQIIIFKIINLKKEIQKGVGMTIKRLIIVIKRMEGQEVSIEMEVMIGVNHGKIKKAGNKIFRKEIIGKVIRKARNIKVETGIISKVMEIGNKVESIMIGSQVVIIMIGSLVEIIMIGKQVELIMNGKQVETTMNGKQVELKIMIGNQVEIIMNGNLVVSIMNGNLMQH